MECYCYLRNVQDCPGRRENSVETKIWRIIQRTNYSIRRNGGISPNLRERQSENPSIRKESVTRNIYWICFDREAIWKGDILIADIEKLKKLDASEMYPIRLNAKEVLISQKDGECGIPVADGSAKLSGRDYEFQEPTLRRESISVENLTAIGKSFDLKEQKMTQEFTRTFGPFKVTSFIVTILNREFNFLCRKKSNSRFHLSFFMS